MIKYSFFKTKGSTFATEQNNILISPISNFEILKNVLNFVPGPSLGV